MNFKLTNIGLVTFTLAIASSNLPDGVDATLQQQQLRGRKLDAPAFCPEQAPANGSSCWGDLPNGWAYGDCDWYKSSWDSTGKSITEHDYCICRRNVGNNNWQCTKDIETMASATTASSPPVTAPGTTSPSPQQQQGTRKVTATDDNFVCPKDAPADASSCVNVLPVGMSSGSCWWQKSSLDGVGKTTTEQDSCSCTKQQNTWSCSKEIDTKTSPPAPSPSPVTTPDDNFCPPYAPTSQTTCKLTGMWVGTCYYSSSAQENETPNTNSQTCLCQNGFISCSSQPYPTDVPATTTPPLAD